MRILVTGHQGYIGTVLSDRLVAAGHEPVGFDTGWFEGCLFGPDHTSDAPSIGNDLRDVCSDQLEGFDVLRSQRIVEKELVAATQPLIPARGDIVVIDALRSVGVERARVDVSAIGQLGGVGGQGFLTQPYFFRRNFSPPEFGSGPHLGSKDRV